MDINTKALKKHNYRITKQRGLTALRVRIPGGHLEASHLALVQRIAEEYGNGTVHITSRQGFEIPGIDFADIPAINALITPLLDMLGVDFGHAPDGYPASGTRNISACIGSRVCSFANIDTTGLAQRIERAVYPHDLHVKIGITGCPNDCAKAHMQDFGIIGVTIPQYDENRCISCNACVKNCTKRVTGALSEERMAIRRSHDLCIGCGECIRSCPTGAWTRTPGELFRLVIMGRTGKKQPRLAATFLEWADEATIVQVIRNAYTYADTHIDRSLPKEHLGYIVDRTGYPAFREAVLEGVELRPETRVAEALHFSGSAYRADCFMTTPGDVTA